jgi:hypothetical protein
MYRNQADLSFRSMRLREKIFTASLVPHFEQNSSGYLGSRKIKWDPPAMGDSDQLIVAWSVSSDLARTPPTQIGYIGESDCSKWREKKTVEISSDAHHTSITFAFQHPTVFFLPAPTFAIYEDQICEYFANLQFEAAISLWILQSAAER